MITAKEYRAIALFSGGLDSLLSVLWMKKQGYEVIPVFFRSYFFPENKAEYIAEKAGIKLRIVDIIDDMLQILRKPRYGFGKYMNPCIDCHALMFRKAGELMSDLDAGFLISGEVLGQRPMSQRLDSLNAVSKYSGYGDYIIRPLSQKLLPDTLPVREGWVDKDKMLDIQGRGRKRQMELADEFGLQEYQTPGGGCLLTDRVYSLRLGDLMKHNLLSGEFIKFLDYGRHFRISGNMKLIIGKNRRENQRVLEMANGHIKLKVSDAQGPLGVLNISGNVGECSHRMYEPTDEELHLAASIFLSYANKAPQTAGVKIIFPHQAEKIITVTKIDPDLRHKYRVEP